LQLFENLLELLESLVSEQVLDEFRHSLLSNTGRWEILLKLFSLGKELVAVVENCWD